MTRTLREFLILISYFSIPAPWLFAVDSHAHRHRDTDMDKQPHVREKNKPAHACTCTDQIIHVQSSGFCRHTLYYSPFTCSFLEKSIENILSNLLCSCAREASKLAFKRAELNPSPKHLCQGCKQVGLHFSALPSHQIQIRLNVFNVTFCVRWCASEKLS